MVVIGCMALVESVEWAELGERGSPRASPPATYDVATSNRNEDSEDGDVFTWVVVCKI